MIVLDTNVVSAFMQSQPEARVIKWLNQQAFDAIWLTSVTVFEVLYGIQCLPAGKKRNKLAKAFQLVIEQDIERRVLPFDEEAAQIAASFASNLKRTGLNIDFRDIQIASIVSLKQATLATRNIKHFKDLGISLVNPWD